MFSTHSSHFLFLFLKTQFRFGLYFDKDVLVEGGGDHGRKQFPSLCDQDVEAKVCSPQLLQADRIETVTNDPQKNMKFSFKK